MEAISFREAIAKTKIDITGEKKDGHTLILHSLLAFCAAKKCIAQFPQDMQDSLFKENVAVAALLHDIGKLSPTFVKKIMSAVGKELAELQNIDEKSEKNWGGHSTISKACLLAYQELEYTKLPAIVGLHHGETHLGNVADCYDYGGKEWQAEREKLVAYLLEKTGSNFPIIENDKELRLITGLTVLADWLASSVKDEELENETAISQSINEVFKNAGFIPLQFKTYSSFEEIFHFPPNHMQETLFSHCTDKGIYIVEAQMGEGKTEAALYAAYKLLYEQKAKGLYFALPTQLTSNKIHERTDDFIKKVLSPDSQWNTLLIHSKAWLYNTELGEDATVNGSWFQVGKRGILAPIAVGTVDNALMAVMRVKHSALRFFALAGKVVILDEVHSYDVYTSKLLLELIQALQEIHCTIIILSATLTKKHLEQFLDKELPNNLEYPLLSYKKQGLVHTIPLQASKESIVNICFSSDHEAFDEALKRAYSGEQVLWIENTVADAQYVFKKLSTFIEENSNIECGLLHSRFTFIDRQEHEKLWVNYFGKESSDRIKNGRILIGTQVLEQSLDIDADFMITRFCPTDMLFQRMGRLWRHEKNRRPQNAKREAYILAQYSLDNTLENPDKCFGKSAKVYAPYVLCRTYEVWQTRETIALPTHIRPLLEATYATRDEEGLWKKLENDLKKEKEKLTNKASTALSAAGKTQSDDNASTRYSQQENASVLLVKNIYYSSNCLEIITLNSELITIPRKFSLSEQKNIAIQLYQDIVQVPLYHAPEKRNNDFADILGKIIYVNSYFRVACVAESGLLFTEFNEEASKQYELSYTKKLGYLAEKKN